MRAPGARTSERIVAVALLALAILPAAAAPLRAGVIDSRCPPGAIAVEPGAAIQPAVERAGEGAAFCLKNGIHRVQAVRPKSGQTFSGEGQTILNGSRLLTAFSRDGRYWVASGQDQRGQKHGRCARDAPACDLPEAVFMDDQPLVPVLRKDSLEAGRFYLDRSSGRLYLADDPAGRKVEATAAAFAFESAARNVTIRNIIIEKYASVAQKGAVQSGNTAWVIENCEVRLNSGIGIVARAGGRVRECDVHHNGQLGIGGKGRDIIVEDNRIWANNIHGFDFGWEAGGLKIVLSDGVILRGNHVHDNVGPGLWCDINCRNVLYEDNIVERNQGAGIFHEISFAAVIRNNTVRNNGIAENTWFWGNDILIAASQDVQVYGNRLTVSPGKCGIMLIDQGRDDQVRARNGPIYKTKNNTIRNNEVTFEGAACAGGASDVKPGHENFSIITDGNNVLDGNLYRVRRSAGPARFAWGHATFDWEGLRAQGVEPTGRMVIY
ncbi:right-handed parallel beta-helix repeat-containing protein [Bradyrhizobium sp. WSM 1704]|uniref:right-handed parallel beta-helix repeat-containing protein n=1 Tax=Bradyrhizobium semiaridum TaxID=2821404 RepID=UPI001CE2EABF|nr:right-handed parallel beta-helix repeat-containing protein [Bradyrhizobium semiaridum]MCA6122018.1 right-handed parallel beta-helix repeat-containing protein [Bradyrhizobium semiaridum]